MESGALAVRATGLHNERPRDVGLLRFLVNRMLTVKTTVFFKLKFVRGVSFIFGRRVIPLLTLGAGQGHNVAHAVFLKNYRPEKPGAVN